VKQAGGQENVVGGGLTAPKKAPEGTNPPGIAPVGTPPSVGTPPIKVSVPQVAPGLQEGVKFCDVQHYVCKAEDTSFVALSIRLFGSPRYAEALLRFNRNDMPNVADEVRADPPRLRQGITVYIPGLEDLEARYPETIPGLKRVPLPAGEPRALDQSSRSSPLSQAERTPATVTPLPAARTPQPVPAIRTPGPTEATPVGGKAAAGPPKEYRVGPGPQHLFLIAQQTLGSGERWHEIYRMNPNVNPENPIPDGTTLRLPADARTP
jgi:hypothetical protein